MSASSDYKLSDRYHASKTRRDLPNLSLSILQLFLYFNKEPMSDSQRVYQRSHCGSWLREPAVKLKPDFRSALFNLALLLADSNRPLEALDPLEQLLQHFPQHVKALILLGDIHTNHKKDLQTAEECYKR